MLSQVNALLGSEQMKKIDSLLTTQRLNAAKWEEVLCNSSKIKPLSLIDGCKPKLLGFWY